VRGGQTARIGLLGIGLETYWAQFPGLEERLKGYVAQVESRLTRPGVVIDNAGLIDTVDKAFAAGDRFRAGDVDAIFLYVTTYALSSTVLPIVQRARVPVIILTLQPDLAIDYAIFNARTDRTEMTGDWLAWCAACPAPEIANVLKRAHISCHEVVGTLLADDPCWQEVDDWVAAVRVARTLAYNRCGLMGHYYNGMLDIYTDVMQVQACFGGHFEILEIDELAALRRDVQDADADARVAEFAAYFDLQDGVTREELLRAARTSVALDQLVARYNLGSMAYYHEGTPGSDHQDVIGSVILGCSLLIDRHVAIAGEYEVKNALAMKILDSFGAGGSFSEYYAIDLADDVVLFGHDGPGHIGIAQGKTKVRPLAVYHGKPSSGLSVEMSVAQGPVTLLSVVEDPAGGFFLLYAQGESVAGPILEIGNTNSRYRFSLGARDFVKNWNAQGPAHHCAIGLGHVGERLEKLAALLGLRAIKIC
jgi:L-arabinose isomerase